MSSFKHNYYHISNSYMFTQKALMQLVIFCRYFVMGKIMLNYFTQCYEVLIIPILFSSHITGQLHSGLINSQLSTSVSPIGYKGSLVYKGYNKKTRFSFSILLIPHYLLLVHSVRIASDVHYNLIGSAWLLLH